MTTYEAMEMMELGNALKSLAAARDREGFKRVADAYLLFARTLPESDRRRERALSFLDWKCAVADHGALFVNVHYPVGETQKLFHELYGSHYEEEPASPQNTSPEYVDL